MPLDGESGKAMRKKTCQREKLAGQSVSPDTGLRTAWRKCRGAAVSGHSAQIKLSRIISIVGIALACGMRVGAGE